MSGHRTVGSFDPIDNVNEEFEARYSAGNEMASFVNKAIQIGHCVRIEVCDGDEKSVYLFNDEGCCEDPEECACPPDRCSMEEEIMEFKFDLDLRDFIDPKDLARPDDFVDPGMS